MTIILSKLNRFSIFTGRSLGKFVVNKLLKIPPCICCHRHTHTHTHARTHARTHTRTHTRTRPFNGFFSGTTQVSRYQKSKTNLDFTEARDSEWQWHQLGHMQVCTSLQTDNHASTPLLSFLQAGCSSCRPTNSVKALKAKLPCKTLT